MTCGNNQEEIRREAAEPVVEDAVEEPQAETSTTSIATFETEAEVVNRLKEISESDEEVTRQELDSLKSNFYRIHRQQADAAYKKFIEEGGAAEEYAPEPDPEETTFKELMAVIREKRAAVAAALEQEREENYQKKLEIIDKIKALTENPDEINRGYNDFKELQQQWNDIKEVPADKATNLWKTYQQAVEAFYDTLKLSNELRAYDFKKCLDVCAASRSDGITCTFVETGIDLIDMVFKLDAMVFEPLNAFRCFFCELVNQDRIAASVAGS